MENMADEDAIDQGIVLSMLVTGELVICNFCQSAIDAGENCTICGEQADKQAEIAAQQEMDIHDLRDTRY